jgi:hypothetical protein
MTKRGWDLGHALDSVRVMRPSGLPTPPPVRERRRFPTGCGTDPGWHTHRRLGQDPCGPCIQAHDKALKAWAEARAARATTPEED